MTHNGAVVTAHSGYAVIQCASLLIQSAFSSHSFIQHSPAVVLSCSTAFTAHCWLWLINDPSFRPPETLSLFTTLANTSAYEAVLFVKTFVFVTGHCPAQRLLIPILKFNPIINLYWQTIIDKTCWYNYLQATPP